MHHLILLGRSTKDAEENTSKSGKSYAKFSVAVNEYNAKDKSEKVYFYDIVVFGKKSEKVAEFVKKGDLVMVQGRPEVDAYISKKDEEAKGLIKVVAESWKVLK